MRCASAWVVVVLAGCGAPSKPDGTGAREHRFANNWGDGLGCTPNGEALALTGSVVVRPFGKGTDGAVIATDAGDWVVSYNADNGGLRELAGRRVRARGHACDKQGEAIVGKHFDLESITEIE